MYVSPALIKFWVLAVIAGVIVFASLAVDHRLDTANQREISGTIASKYVKRYHHEDRYMLEIETASGVEVVQVRDSIWSGDFRSADRYAKLKEGEQVTVTVAGYRSGVLSLFPRVIK